MKFHLSRLKIGQDLVAQVAECFADGDVLVDFHGDLIRVKNQTAKRFFPGDMIPLRVTSIKPLGFQFVPRSRGAGKIDVSI